MNMEEHVPLFETFAKRNSDGPKGRDLSVFIRYGGLDLKPQKGFKKDVGFSSWHSPPTTKGIYAMPRAAQELFLVGSLDKTQPANFPKTNFLNKQKEYNDPTRTPEDDEIERKQWEEFHKRREAVYSQIRKTFVKTDGYVWHHLGADTAQREIIARHGAWVKSSMAAWRKAFMKVSLKYRYGDNRDSGLNMSTKSINAPIRSGSFGIYSKDEFEVFFDEKV